MPDREQIQQRLIAALQKHDSGHWQSSNIHCCLTGKNTDCDNSGQQGVEVCAVRGSVVQCIAHINASFAGCDVSLNVPDDLPEELYEQCQEAYMSAAQGIIEYCGLTGEWTGDDWCLGSDIYFTVPLVLDRHLRVRYSATAKRIIGRADELLVPLERSIAQTHAALDESAGWGEPTQAAFQHLLADHRPHSKSK